jgi:hypothetical protein
LWLSANSRSVDGVRDDDFVELIELQQKEERNALAESISHGNVDAVSAQSGNGAAQ